MSNETGLPSAAQLVPDNGDYNNPVAGRLQDYSGYKDYRTVNPYDFLEHTYSGTRHYRDCGYLQYTDREMFYQTRRKISYYVNVFKPIINAMVDPVFSGEIMRKTSNILFEAFIDNCDNNGTSFNVFMKNAIKNARLFSLNFVVVDNFDMEKVQAPETLLAQAETRAIPYVYERNPQHVHKWECDEQGKLTSITFIDKCEDVKIDGKMQRRQYYRQWDSMTWTLYYEEKDKQIVESYGTHGLGVIPVVAITNFANSANLKCFPDPEFYNMAVLVHGLFNKESQVNFMEIMQTFAILCTSGMGTSAKSIGPATFLDSGTDSKYPPQYVSPSQDGIKTLIDNCERLKREIKDEAKQSGVIGVIEAKSGIAKEWDFRAEEQILKATAEAGEETEEKIAKIFGLYIGSEIPYEVEYQHSFDPAADDNDIASALLILKEMPPAEIVKNLWLDIAARRWKNNPEKLEAIKAALESDMVEAAAIKAMQAQEAMTMTNQDEAKK